MSYNVVLDPSGSGELVIDDGTTTGQLNLKINSNGSATLVTDDQSATADAGEYNVDLTAEGDGEFVADTTPAT